MMHFLFFTSTAAEAAEKYLVLLHILNKRFELFLWLHIDLLFKKILLNFKDVDILLVYFLLFFIKKCFHFVVDCIMLQKTFSVYIYIYIRMGLRNSVYIDDIYIFIFGKSST